MPFEIFKPGNSTPIILNELIERPEQAAGGRTSQQLPVQSGDVPAYLGCYFKSPPTVGVPAGDSVGRGIAPVRRLASLGRSDPGSRLGGPLRGVVS